ncbi:glycosyltransferase, MGT family [Amycolatopsis xylanica]|uniref:Glycosyltransferase, MGT family n=1 Tax=Amycolatopsis xylanica TaxID=589385 RepID=A0A1H2T4B1_9PSEU|nr:nucleotide disphospho-sugar-binding domain-containing protein [Amycolatopsis xylanica]SDW38555.1 glycosyltransferase, MGT family [Amycolatopsis xylanica]
MRILCSTTPMEGVFAPVLPLLRSRTGDDVLVATGPDLVDRVRSAGLTAVAAGPAAPAAAARAMTDPMFTAGSEPWRIGAVMFSRVMAPEKLPALTAIADDFAPDVILHPPVDLAAPLLAARRGIPSITYGTGLLLEPELVSAMARWVAPLWTDSGLSPDTHAGLYRHRYLNPVPASLQPDLGPASACASQIRPAVPGSTDDLPPWASQLGDRPVIYVSLGTIPIFNQPSFFAPILEALDDVDVIVTIGHTATVDSLGPLPPNIHAENWLSLAAVLPRCDAVVCHSGAGTTLAALSSGLPLVLLPRGADQFPTAAACERAGAAQVITPDRLTADAVRHAVATVLKDDSYRSAARGLQTEINAMPTAATVELP